MRPWSTASRRLRLAAAAVALAGLGAAAGCGNANPAVAAYVDGTTISQSQLDAAIEGVQQAVGKDQQVSPQAVLNAMVHGAIADQVAAKNKIVVTDAERDATLQGSNLESLLPIPAAKEVAYDIADQQIVSQQVGSAYLDEIARQQVTVNPRYGVLDPEQKVLIPNQSGSLAKPASPSPEPTP